MNQTKNVATATGTTTAPKPKPLTKSQLKTQLATDTGLTAKQVGTLLESLAKTATAELNRKGVGAFTVPDLVKLTKTVKKATAERQGINPLTKAPMTIKAKPERNVVRVRALKGLKDSVL